MNIVTKNIFLVGFIVLSLAVGILFFLNGKNDLRIDHIYLITIDTLRADHLGCYGYPRNTSPFIDTLARKGIVFTKAFSQSATTAPSHASIFTGLYPYQHKVLANGLLLDDSYTTLAEILKQKGFKTTGFASTVSQFKKSNLNQGFDFYSDPETIQNIISGKYSPARLTRNNCIYWLSNFIPGQKLFMWIHFFDPHTPYRPPSEFIEKIQGSTNNEEFLKYIKNIPINHKLYIKDKNKLIRNITKYDSEIRYVDYELEQLFNFINYKKLNKNALWIITSDHGECLGQHEWYTHGKHLYQEAIHVPLIFYFTNQRLKTMVIPDVVENFDIFPTLFEGLNIKIDKKLIKMIKATSLWRRIIGKDSKINRKYAFSQRRKYFQKTKPKENSPTWQHNWEDGEKYCVQNHLFKYIFRTAFPDELYDLKNDVFEMNNKIIKKNWQKIKKNLQNIMYSILHDMKKYKDKKIQKVNKKERKQLESLGYIL